MNTLDILKAMRALYVIEEGMGKGQKVEITNDLFVICNGTGWDWVWNGEESEKVAYTHYRIEYKGEEVGSANGSAFDVIEECIRILAKKERELYEELAQKYGGA